MSKCLCWPKKSKYIKEVLGDRGECFVFWHRVSREGEGRGRKEEIVAPGSRKEEKEERERGRNFIAFLRLGEKKRGGGGGGPNQSPSNRWRGKEEEEESTSKRYLQKIYSLTLCGRCGIVLEAAFLAAPNSPTFQKFQSKLL